MNKRNVARGVLTFTVLAFALIIALALSGCNMKTVDMTYNFNYAWISLPNGSVIEGKVQSWKDFEDGDQIQVKIDDVTYLTDTTRCVLASGYRG